MKVSRVCCLGQEGGHRLLSGVQIRNGLYEKCCVNEPL